ncbi:endolytic transglycosylase MltG [Arcanobacterium hippocoleae]|uniref:Endolytic murein transglycosylase n=1 Tax=Arcanobacterium hippocoleae TaxID=149017 RepID=A0ABU1T0C7_9ACTO|nr:endolytic transglycosylase MltG [Arcanobacterium hippocoleae]MDR6938749.1 UPF0755 protein [Arcanobacterium hippocoleae]
MVEIFETNAGFPQNHSRRQKSRKTRARQYAAWVISLFSIMLIVMSLVIVWPRISALLHSPKYEDYQGNGNGNEVVIEIPKDATGTEIGTILAKEGIVASKQAFTKAFTENPRANSIQSGTFKLQQKMSGASAVSALLDPANRAEIRVTIPEGFRKTQVFQRIANVLKVSPEAVAKAAENAAAIGLPAEANGDIEGWIAPLTYELKPDTNATEVLKLMVSHRIKELENLGLPRDKWLRTLTIASIAQREVSYPQEYAKVARVIENRLTDNSETNGLLQMDSTVMYGLQKTESVPTAEDLADENPYNTYKHKGLPPGPISNPSRQAIEGAMNPASGDWLYFVTVNLDTGETKFTNTLKEHEKYVAEFRAWYDKNRR